jgi:hypothetical protein
MTTSNRFETKTPSEKRVLTFDFTLDLATGETLSGTPTVTVTCVRGKDSNPSAILAGGATLDGTQKIYSVPVAGGLNDCDYDVVVLYPTTNAKKSLELGGILPVLSQ